MSKSNPRPLTRLEAAFYGLPNISMAMLWTPLNVMQGVYVKYFAIPMSTLAAILLISRVYDALADFGVGGVSDWVRRRTGRRKPMVALGAVLFSLGALAAYAPPHGVGRWYLAGALFAFFTGYAAFTIPHMAWGSDLARRSVDKTRVFSARVMSGYVGLCGFYLIPTLPFWPSAEITPLTLKVAVGVAIAVLIPGFALNLRYVPEAQVDGDHAPQAAGQASGWAAVAANRPFLILMSAFGLCGLSLAIWYGMIFIFVDIYLGRGELYSRLYLLAFAVAALVLTGWERLSRRLGKKTAWTLGMLVVLVSYAMTFAVRPSNATAWVVGALLVVNTIGFVTLELLVGSLVGDAADYGMLKTGRNRSATYFAVFMFLAKIVFAVGAATALWLASALGFDPHARVQTAAGERGLFVVMVWLPAALMVMGLVAIRQIPIDERRHAIVRRRLDLLSVRTAPRRETDPGPPATASASL